MGIKRYVEFDFWRFEVKGFWPVAVTGIAVSGLLLWFVRDLIVGIASWF